MSVSVLYVMLLNGWNTKVVEEQTFLFQAWRRTLHEAAKVNDWNND